MFSKLSGSFLGAAVGLLGVLVALALLGWWYIAYTGAENRAIELVFSVSFLWTNLLLGMFLWMLWSELTIQVSVPSIPRAPITASPVLQKVSVFRLAMTEKSAAPPLSTAAMATKLHSLPSATYVEVRNQLLKAEAGPTIDSTKLAEGVAKTLTADSTVPASVVIQVKQLVAAMKSDKGNFTEKMKEIESILEPTQEEIPSLSYSRICGSIGMVVMAAMFVAVIDFSLYVAFHPADKEGTTNPIIALLNSLQLFFLAGMSLFAPYGVNKFTDAIIKLRRP